MKSYRKQILLGAAVVLVVGVVQAGEVCNTISECQKLKQQADAKIQQLQGGLSQLGDFLRNKDGTVKIGFNQYQADEICKTQGKRLPTARELAIEGTKHGAEMLELSQVSSNKVPEGFYWVKVVNPDGKKDQFYYSYENYVRPAGDLGNYWIWSSSVLPVNGGDVAFNLLNNGNIFYVFRDEKRYYDDAAVRCIGSAGVNH